MESLILWLWDMTVRKKVGRAALVSLRRGLGRRSDQAFRPTHYH